MLDIFVRLGTNEWNNTAGAFILNQFLTYRENSLILSTKKLITCNRKHFLVRTDSLV